MPTKSQLAIIHVAKKQLGLCDDTYRDVLHAVAGVSSAKHLGPASFKRVMERFRELGFDDGKGRKNFGARVGMATPDQLRYIQDLWEQYWGEANERALGNWIKKYYGVSDLRFLDERRAGPVITALKRMATRPRKGDIRENA